MEIKNLPTRFPEIGRIRLGRREMTTNKKGEPYERPVKGENLIFTSVDEVALKAIASQHGGEVEPWEGGEQPWRLQSETPSIPVYLPFDPIDTSYEKWGSGGCQRRCDGELCVVPVQDGEGGYLEERPCACLAEGRTPGDKADKAACKVTVRLRLVLPDVPGIGIWLCTSHSVYAAMELPGQVALLESMREKGQLVPAEFAIEPRREKKPWEKYARDYIVPVLRIRASLHELGASPGTTEIAPPVMPELDRATHPFLPPPSLAPAGRPFEGDETPNHVRIIKAKALTGGIDSTTLGDFVTAATDGRTADVNELRPEEAGAVLSEIAAAKHG